MKTDRLKYIAIPLLFISLTFFFTCTKYIYRTVYNQLDFILYLEVKKYFNPDDSQSEFVKRKLASLHKWNRINMLPRMRNLLIYLKKTVHTGLSEKSLIYLYQTLDSEFEILADKASPHAAEFVLTLNNEQLENYKQERARHMEEEKERNKKYGKNPSERITRSTVKLLSKFYGSFSDRQIKQIKEYILSENIASYDRWEYQNIKQHEFIKLLIEREDKDKITAFLKNWITRNSATTPAPFKKIFRERRKFRIALFLYVDKNIVTSRQRINAVETFDEWIETINTLVSGT